MENAGISFQIPNKYGKYLADILESIPFSKYKWLVDNDEIHLLKNNEFTNQFLFKEEDKVIEGKELYRIAKDNDYYIVFVTLKGFLKDGIVKSVKTYKEFKDSDCQIILGIYDCSYVMIWCKEEQLVSKIYNYVTIKGYKDIKFICEDDLIKEKYYLE